MAEWSEDICTCTHPVSQHKGAKGQEECEGCWAEKSYNRLAHICTRYQWDGEPRKKQGPDW